MVDEKKKEIKKENKAPIKSSAPAKKQKRERAKKEYTALELASILKVNENRMLSLFSILKLPRYTGTLTIEDAREKYSKIMGKR